jgi:serine/threonine protein kinase
MITCPSAATLARLGIDSLDGADFASIEAHIETCADCRDMLDRLHRNDAGSGSFAAERLPGPEAPPRIPGFVIERELGRGSMSVVYLARQPSLGRLVALKVVRSGPSAGSHEYARWLREGRSFSRLKHENVVRLHDLGEADGWLYLVLEYVPGGTLNDRLDAPYAARDAARLLATIAGAVAAIHRQGLLHLDLKPSNILIEEMPATPRELATPRVGDFGLAYRWDDPDATANAVGLTGPIGTPRYMAPEQVDAGREQLGPAADVYGLGALLYHVLTGRPPFVAPSVAETLEQVRNQDPVPPRRLNPAIPRDLETICLKCLRKQPGQRYQSADAVAGDLRRFLDGVAISARPVSPLERTWRWGRRRPAVAALASLLMLSLVGGFLGMFLLWRHAESQRGRAESARGQAEMLKVRAEEAQARAEADFQLASKVLDQLVDLNVGGMGGLPKSASPEDTISVLRSIRRRLFDLAPRLPDRARTFYQLNAVDARMSDILGEQGRWEELRMLLEESLWTSEVAVREYPGIRSVWRWRAHHLEILASISEREGKMDRCESYLRRSIV